MVFVKTIPRFRTFIRDMVPGVGGHDQTTNIQRKDQR
jgi:hypothetical protein